MPLFIDQAHMPGRPEAPPANGLPLPVVAAGQREAVDRFATYLGRVAGGAVVTGGSVVVGGRT